MNIEQLKLMAVQKLPEKIFKKHDNSIHWRRFDGEYLGNNPVKETEWLHIAHLLEELFWNDQQISSAYCYQLDLIVQPRRDDIMINEFGYTGFITHATPEQKLAAMYASNFLKD